MFIPAARFSQATGKSLHVREGLSPAMAAGLTDRLWDMKDVVTLIDAAAPKPGERGPYKKRNSN